MVITMKIITMKKKTMKIGASYVTEYVFYRIYVDLTS